MVKKTEWRIAIIAAILALTVAIAYLYRHSLRSNGTYSTISLPMQIGEWKGKEERVSDRVYSLLEADTVLIRTYRKDADELWFAMVYYKDNQIGFHTPESCFGGLGNQVFKEEKKSLYIDTTKDEVKINNLRYKGAGGEKILYYFYQVEDYSTDSYLKIRVKLLRENLKMKRPGVALFEIYSNIATISEKKAVANLDNFISHLIPDLPKYIK